MRYGFQSRLGPLCFAFCPAAPSLCQHRAACSLHQAGLPPLGKLVGSAGGHNLSQVESPQVPIQIVTRQVSGIGCLKGVACRMPLYPIAHVSLISCTRDHLCFEKINVNAEGGNNGDLYWNLALVSLTARQPFH